MCHTWYHGLAEACDEHAVNVRVRCARGDEMETTASTVYDAMLPTAADDDVKEREIKEDGPCDVRITSTGVVANMLLQQAYGDAARWEQYHQERRREVGMMQHSTTQHSAAHAHFKCTDDMCVVIGT